MDHPGAPLRVLLGQRDHPIDHLELEVLGHRDVAIQRTVLPDQPEGPSVAHVMTLHQARDRVPPPGRAQNLPLLKSLSIEMYGACSTTMCLSVAFSCSGCLTRMASSSFNAPHLMRRR